MSTTSTNILASKNTWQQNKPELPGEMSQFTSGEGNTQDEPGASFTARKLKNAKKEKTHYDEGISKGHRS